MIEGGKPRKALGGIAPFGYRWQVGSLVVDEREAPVRKLIYELFLKHRRKKTVATVLNDLGYRTRSASLFSDTTIDRLLRDTTAKGIREVDGKPVEVEPIITPEIWERVNNILGGKSAKQSPHLFSGIAYCSCGGRMIVPGNLAKYVCIDCRRKILVPDLEEIFLSQLKGPGEPEKEGLFENWEYFSQKEKRVIVEQICERIVIGPDTINIQLCYSFSPTGCSEPPADEAQCNSAVGYVEDQRAEAASISEPLLSEVEAAKFLGISKMTVLRRRNAGEIGYFRVGFRVLYSKEKHLIPFLKGREK